MERVLKGWLVDNSVTADNLTDKILRLESAGNATLADVLDEMKREDTGLRQETLEHVVNLYNRVVADLVLSGYEVNTGLCYLTPRFRGIVEGGTWNPEKNSIYVSITQGKVLREAIAKTSVKILGERQGTMYIAGGEDAATRATDTTATPGRNYILTGRQLKLAGDDPAVGITLTSEEGAQTRLDADMVAVNEPSRLVFLLPSDLADGAYTLTVTTQYSAGGKLLKEPRSISCTIIVGEAPATPGGETGGSEGSSGGDGDDDFQLG